MSVPMRAGRPASGTQLRISAVALLLTVLVPLAGCTAADRASEAAAPADRPARDAETTARQATVAARGPDVMPFDLERTTHVFEPQPEGGVQVVRSDDGDSEQIALIQRHLEHEAERFGRGDFGDPASLHGEDMPGLAALQDGHQGIEVRYEALPDGARITYRTDDPALVHAIHSWFNAQVSDHGAHAEMH